VNTDFWKRLFVPNLGIKRTPVEPGVYHAMRERDGSYTRFHLRADNDGSGMLLANATAGARLNPTGVLIAKKLLDGADASAIIPAVTRYFREAEQETVRRDITRVQELIERLAAPGDVYPIMNFEHTAFSPYAAQLIAPLQADVPLAEPEKLLPLLRRLWEAGIPHVTFVVPEHPDTAALVRAVERAEDLGMIAGVRGRGSDLHGINLLRDLALAGVDYITVPYASTQEKLHDSLYGKGDHAAARGVIVTVQEYEVCPVAEVPLVAKTTDQLEDTFSRLQKIGVGNLSLFAVTAPKDTPQSKLDGAIAANALLQIASQIEETSHQANMRYVWLPPTLRNATMPLTTQVQQGPRCSGDVAIRVEPDGAVVPGTGAYRSVGNLLRDPWRKIWQDPAFRPYREQVDEPEDPTGLSDLTLAGVDDSDRPAAQPEAAA
jgi:MoaA/NifB/PqqE/SkfB family radical SAM enzyme